MICFLQFFYICHFDSSLFLLENVVIVFIFVQFYRDYSFIRTHQYIVILISQACFVWNVLYFHKYFIETTLYLIKSLLFCKYVMLYRFMKLFFDYKHCVCWYLRNQIIWLIFDAKRYNSYAIIDLKFHNYFINKFMYMIKSLLICNYVMFYRFMRLFCYNKHCVRWYIKKQRYYQMMNVLLYEWNF